MYRTLGTWWEEFGTVEVEEAASVGYACSGLFMRPCPHCKDATPRQLEVLSPFVLSFKCDTCGCVFSIDRDYPDAPPYIVRPRTRRDG